MNKNFLAQKNSNKNLVIFDLDHTLINGDSAVLWNEFVHEQGLVDDPQHLQELQSFKEAYHAGSLDALAYQHFTMKIFSRYKLAELRVIRENYFQQKIAPLMLEPAQQLLKDHQRRGDSIILISATNSFLTVPLCKKWGINVNLSTSPEIINGRFTGKVAGDVSFKAGKVHNLEKWLSKRTTSYANITFYSDSHNDLPLLELANNAIAVDPDPILRKKAIENQWPIVSLREKLHAELSYDQLGITKLESELS